MEELSLEPWFSDSTNEDISDSDTQVTTTITVKCSKVGPLIDRYYAAVKALKREIGLFNDVNGTRMYKLEPILLQENVDGSILEEMSPLVGDVYVKLVVHNSCLYITNLSDGYAHGAAVTDMVAQGGVWSRHVFSIKSHTVLSSDDNQHASTPDLVIEVPTGHLAAGETSARLGNYVYKLINIILAVTGIHSIL